MLLREQDFQGKHFVGQHYINIALLPEVVLVEFCKEKMILSAIIEVLMWMLCNYLGLMDRCKTSIGKKKLK